MASVNAWTHDDLATDLAQHLCGQGVMVWTDMQLGPSGSARPDVYLIEKSFAHTRAMAYEVKVSRADFRADVTKGKWQSYLPFSNGVYFAAPAGLLTRDDLPPGTGLMVRGPNGWRSLRRPTLGQADIDWVVCRKLLIDGQDRMVRPQPRRERQTWGATEKIARRWGQRAAKVLGDLDAAERQVEVAKLAAAEMAKGVKDREARMREEARSEIDAFLRDAAAMMGVPKIESIWQLRETFQGWARAVAGGTCGAFAVRAMHVERAATFLREQAARLDEQASALQALDNFLPTVVVQ